MYLNLILITVIIISFVLQAKYGYLVMSNTKERNTKHHSLDYFMHENLLNEEGKKFRKKFWLHLSMFWAFLLVSMIFSKTITL